MSILISDPGEEVRQKAAFMVEAMADHRQFVADAADSLVRLLYKLMGVESCARHVLREDGTIIRDVKNGNSNDALHDDDDDDTKENDDDEEMEVDYGDYDSSSSPPPSWPFIISANPNPSSNKMMTMRKKKKPETISSNVIAVGPSRKRKPLSPKFNSPSVLNLMSPSEATTSTAEEEEEEEEEERPRLSHSPAATSVFAPSSAAALIRPSKRPRKVSPHAAGELCLMCYVM